MQVPTITMKESKQYVTLSVPSQLADRVNQILTQNCFQIVNFEKPDIARLSSLNNSYNYFISIYEGYLISMAKRFKKAQKSLKPIKTQAKQKWDQETNLLNFFKQVDLKGEFSKFFLLFLSSSYLIDHVKNTIKNPKEQQRLINSIPFFEQYITIGTENSTNSIKQSQQESLSNHETKDMTNNIDVNISGQSCNVESNDKTHRISGESKKCTV